MKQYAYDLHIHSCLSPCSELAMTPKRIVNEALKKGLDIIAIIKKTFTPPVKSGGVKIHEDDNAATAKKLFDMLVADGTI